MNLNERFPDIILHKMDFLSDIIQSNIYKSQDLKPDLILMPPNNNNNWRHWKQDQGKVRRVLGGSGKH